MPFYYAKVADIVRSSQRDELFIESLYQDILSICKTLNIKNFIYLRKVIPIIASSWYYFLTSFDNLQTLGEEYAGILRLDRDKKLPNKLLHIIWLVLYIGGESLYDRLFNHVKTNIAGSTSLVDRTKDDLLKLTTFLLDNKTILLKLHQSWFYIDGAYYNISNRITGIRYVLLREWLQDDSSTRSFKILGKISLIYLVYSLFQQAASFSSIRTSTFTQETVCYKKLCTLCAEYRKSTCATACGHIYCWNCIHDSLRYQQNCPICREIIHPGRIIFLQNFQ
ncbi:hypothetical protein ILUMI_05172 [Ignelater luminosus]|uniref:RING-type E3 ubiquitin transferase n=1 Tax=Ignelater luminosus TaxID=2038154 RepID=A0A8K0GGM8_IGNLU|nr:hypothetical protein ILUMI_05172 [Ignelater luminosus]